MNPDAPPPGQSSPSARHVPVMAGEVLSFLVTDPDGFYIDGTVGLGGHAEGLARALGPSGRLLAIDRDARALEIAEARLAPWRDRVVFRQDNFKNLPLILNGLGVSQVAGLMLDLGVSSMQLDSPERGFSFQVDGPLDMRMDNRQRITAADLVNGLPEGELADLIFQYGEERHSRRVARRLVEARAQRRVTTTTELAAIVASALPRPAPGAIHPATRTFQALRIVVNSELTGLGNLLEETMRFLTPGGRLVVIAFHSLEDRIVKTTFLRLAGRCVCRRPPVLCQCPRRELARVLTRKPVGPGEPELAANPRSRSARLRAVERLDQVV